LSHIPFIIPDVFSVGVASGKIIRFGTVLKDASSGQIIAHLQETGLGQKLLSGASTVPFSPLGAINLASSTYTNIQITQLKSMVSSLTMMNFATLGATLTGLGVSIVGFILIKKKLDALEKQIFDIKNQLDRNFKDIFEREIRTHYSSIQTLLNELQIAHTLRNPTNILMSISSRLAEESGYFKGELNYILEQEKFDKNIFQNFLQAMTTCNSVRLECFLLANELDTANASARQSGQELSFFSNKLEPNILTERTFGSNWKSGNVSSVVYRAKQQEMKNFVSGLRDATEVAETKPFLIDTLIKNDINGRDYIQSLQDERDRPLLILWHSRFPCIRTDSD